MRLKRQRKSELRSSVVAKTRQYSAVEGWRVQAAGPALRSQPGQCERPRPVQRPLGFMGDHGLPLAQECLPEHYTPWPRSREPYFLTLSVIFVQLLGMRLIFSQG